MEFASSSTARTYSDRAVDKSWCEWALRTLLPRDKDVVDIGCGGGIYSHGFAAIGARSVIGIDKSPQYIEEAMAGLPQPSPIVFKVGSAESTPIPDHSADIVFERAVIHHLSTQEQNANAAEAMRLLRPGGLFVVQDRTIEDVLSIEPSHWIRATLFETFPRLIEFEAARRPSQQAYVNVLTQAGFSNVDVLRYDEIRKTYGEFNELRDEVLARKGKSILFELSDTELGHYSERLQEKALKLPLTEQDSWTIWRATK